MTNVILRHLAGGAGDELVVIDLPPDISSGNTFEYGGREWEIVGGIDASDTPLAVRGTSALLAIPARERDR